MHMSFITFGKKRKRKVQNQGWTDFVQKLYLNWRKCFWWCTWLSASSTWSSHCIFLQRLSSVYLRSCPSGVRGRAFTVTAPQLWNSIPKDTCLALSLQAFWCHVMTTVQAFNQTVRFCPTLFFLMVFLIFNYVLCMESYCFYCLILFYDIVSCLGLEINLVNQ